MNETSWKSDLQKTAARLAEATGHAPAVLDDRIELPVTSVDAQACYFVTMDGASHQIAVGFSTTDRWLSQSIEADLMFRGDDIEDLLAEELADQGYAGRLQIEHYRDDTKRYVFRSLLPDQEGDIPQESIVSVIKAYAACFADLGDLREE